MSETRRIGSNSATKLTLTSSFIQPVPDYRRLGRCRCVQLEWLVLIDAYFLQL